jgi:nucleotide-binding universal stress UspA family protein
MVYLVPFDGSVLSEAALVKATKFGTAVGERVLAFSVVRAGKPGDAVALDSGPETVEEVVGRLHDAVESLAPNADFEHATVDRYAPTGAITSRIRRFADERDVSMVFVGSENAGRIATSLTSVGRGLATDDGYDVVIVRQFERDCLEHVRAANTQRTLELYSA